MDSPFQMNMSEEPAATNVIMPSELLDTALLDAQGRVWTFRKEIYSWLLFFKRTRYHWFSNRTLAPHLDASFRDAARRAFRRWREKDVPAILTEAKKGIEDALATCQKEALQNLRQEFIQKMGSFGTRTLRTILEEQFDELTKYLEEHSELTKNSRSLRSPLLPSNAKFWWQFLRKAGVIDMFCFEFPPARRTIKIAGQFRTVMFPWLTIIVCFLDGKMLVQHSGHRCGFWIFYRTEALTSREAVLLIPNMPHISDEWPYLFCLGDTNDVFPSVTLENPAWSTELLDYFWQSKFAPPEAALNAWKIYRDVIKKVPEIGTLEAWERLSEKEPERILTLPWPRFEKNLQQFVDGIAEWLGDESIQEAPGKREVKERLAEQFGRRLEEELVFLGIRAAITPATGKQAAELGERVVDALEKKSLLTLHKRGKEIVYEAIEKFQKPSEFVAIEEDAR